MLGIEMRKRRSRVGSHSRVRIAMMGRKGKGSVRAGSKIAKAAGTRKQMYSYLSS